MIDKTLVGKLKNINFYHSVIKFLESKILEERNAIESDLKTIGMEIDVCDKCLGGGGRDRCPKCHGAGYIAVRID